MNHGIQTALQTEFEAWLDSALSEPIAESVVAFTFNLAEPWCVEIVGSDIYDEEDPDWACEETFRPEIQNFPLPSAQVGATWQEVLESAKQMITNYLNRSSPGSTILKSAIAVTVGFVDGELHRLSPS